MITVVELQRDDRAPGERVQPRQRILVVDDNEPTRRLYATVLARSGYEVETVEDGEAGWRALHAEEHDPANFDLLITDNDMPKLSGLELVKKLRNARWDLPIILASGSAPFQTESLEITEFLPKPFALDLLVKAVKSALALGPAEHFNFQSTGKHDL